MVTKLNDEWTRIEQISLPAAASFSQLQSYYFAIRKYFFCDHLAFFGVVRLNFSNMKNKLAVDWYL